MKKFLITAVITSLISGVAFAADSNVVSSANVVGYSQLPLEPGGVFYLTTCNFVAESNTLVDIFGTNQLAQSGSIGSCDRVVRWDPDTDTYQTYAQYTDGNFYKANSQIEFNGSPVVNPQIPLGEGLWIISSDTASSTNTISFSGDVVSVETQTVDVVSDFQILSYPYSSDIPLNDTAFNDSGATKSDTYSLCDKIAVWENPTYQSYGLAADGNWYKANDAVEWNTAPLATNDIALSQGIWYIASGGFSWVETNRYMSVFE